MPVQGPGYSYPNSTASGPFARSGENSRTGESSKTGENSKTGTDSKTEESQDTNTIDAVYGDASDKMVTMDDFLTLMVSQLKNQDFMNPMDDTQYVTQLAQISTMQQMEEMAYNAKTTYVTSLVGKNVVAAKFTVSGELKQTDGIVSKISLLDGKFVIFVDDEPYGIDEIMEVKATVAADPGENVKPGEDTKPGDDTDTEGAGGSDNEDGAESGGSEKA